MTITLSDIDPSEADDITRHVHVPAMRSEPFFQTTFPDDRIGEETLEEIIKWYAEMYADAFQNESEKYLKACSSESTMPVGVCGWIIMEHGKSLLQQNDKKKKSWFPSAMDIERWLEVSEALKEERERALEGYNNIYR